MLTDRIPQFYEDNRWNGWEAEVAAAGPDRGTALRDAFSMGRLSAVKLGRVTLVLRRQRRVGAEPRLEGGGDKAVAQIGNLATQNQLESPALQVAVMLALMGKAKALQPLADRVAAFVKHVTDIIFSAQSVSWGMAMQYYALLQRRAATDAELASLLDPVTQFFAYRHPSKKAPVGSPNKAQRKAVTKAKRSLTTVGIGRLAGAGATAANPQPAAAAASAAPATGPSTTPSTPATPRGDRQRRPAREREPVPRDALLTLPLS